MTDNRLFRRRWGRPARIQIFATFLPQHQEISMPNPHYERKWWSELPETAQEAALTLGYTQETWDADSKIPYDFQDFHECSNDEKESAMYLGLDPIKKKLDIWWDDTDKKTLAEAKVLGWSKETWDKDWQIEHLPCNKWYWDEMTSTQQKAARHFGYTKGTWDETWEVEEKKVR